MAVSRNAAIAGIFLLLLHWGCEFALAKKNFKGLFGSYRREKFTENEGNASDWGVDLMLSTLYPLSTFASAANSASVTTSSTGTALPSTISFNLELNLYKTWGYHWLTYVSIGRYNYDTRSLRAQQDNSTEFAQLTQYNLFDMTIVPIMLGVKYRFSRSDFVPYLGLAVGASLISREMSYNYSDQAPSTSNVAPSIQAYGGFEFFFAPGAGLRLELGMWTALLAADAKSSGGNQIDSFILPANPMALRYASGVFFLF